MDLLMVLDHEYLTDEFYGQNIPNIVGEVFDVSNPENTKLLCRTEVESVNSIMLWSRLKMTGDIYQWTVRQKEILSSSRDYELTIDINSGTEKYDELICIPNTIKTLIGEFCNPVIASGYIILDIQSSPLAYISR